MAEIVSVPTRTIHGQLAQGNHDSLEWSWNGLLAFGCQNQVVVAETRDLNVVQTLDKHKYLVSKVKWPQDNTMKLASCDVKGNIVIWDIVEGKLLTMILGDAKDTKNIQSLEWVKGDPAGGRNPSGTYILVLYASNLLVIYDTELGQVHWKKAFASGHSHIDYNLKDFSLDPFSRSNIILSLTPSTSQNIHCCFLLIDNYLSSAAKMKRYQLYVRSDNPLANSPMKSPRLQLAVKQVADSLSKGDGEENSNYLLEYKQITHHKSRRNEIVLVFPKEVVVVNMTNLQIMTVIPSKWPKVHDSLTISIINRHSGTQRRRGGLVFVPRTRRLHIAPRFGQRGFSTPPAEHVLRRQHQLANGGTFVRHNLSLGGHPSHETEQDCWLQHLSGGRVSNRVVTQQRTSSNQTNPTATLPVRGRN